MYTYHAPVPREKRGIVNLFGDISKTLFGTATDTDVLECKRQVRLVIRMTERVVHYVIYFISQTYEHLVQNRKHILSLQDYVEKVSAEIHFTEVVNEALWSLHVVTGVDKVMFHRQRASLEIGFLTAELISIQELLRILTAGRRAWLSSPNVNWYYETIRVSTTSRTEHQLIVRVRLPLTDSVSYITFGVGLFRQVIMYKLRLPPT